MSTNWSWWVFLNKTSTEKMQCVTSIQQDKSFHVNKLVFGKGERKSVVNI